MALRYRRAIEANLLPFIIKPSDHHPALVFGCATPNTMLIVGHGVVKTILLYLALVADLQSLLDFIPYIREEDSKV